MNQRNKFNNNICRSDEVMIYTDNMDIIENDNTQYLVPNSIVLTSYNYNISKNYHYYYGTSYELFYVDNDLQRHQITYSVGEGNGLYIDNSYHIYVGIDNKTIKENEKNEIYVDSNELVYAYNNTIKGVLAGENKIFYDHALNKSGFTTSYDGIIKVSNGLLMSLYEIQNYYDNFELMTLQINRMAIKLNYNVDLFEVGDILYIDSEGKYTKNSEGNMPFMVCVIASNTLQDNCARFIPLKHADIENIFAKNSHNIYYKNLYSNIPVYNTDLNMLTDASKIVGGSYGFISTDNIEWENNFKNPFNFKEHYFANLNTIKTDIIWYVDPDVFHKQDMYSVEVGAIVTELISLQNLEFNDDICPIVEIKFSDGFTGYYMFNFDYVKDRKRFELKEGSKTTIYPLLLVNELNNLTNNILTNNDKSKIKIYDSNTLINSEELINKYRIYLNDNNNEPDKFKNDNMNDIDYKILVNQLKDNKETIVNTNTVTKSRTVTDTIEHQHVDYDEVVIKANPNKWIYSETIDENGLVTYRFVKDQDKVTLIPRYWTTTEYIDRIEYYDETTTTYTYNIIYTYKLIIDSNICDKEKVYLKVQLGDSSNNLSDIMYLTYENSKGLEYVFTEYSSTIKTGYIKIIAYASSEYYDQIPVDLGIIAVNEYDKSFKCIHLTKEYNSFKFNLQNIIPVETKIYKNYSILELHESAIILESNYYNDFENTLEYVLDVNYFNKTENDEYVLIPGAIIIYIKDKFIDLFDERNYMVSLEIRNLNGYNVIGKYKFLKQNSTLILNTQIKMYDIKGINQIFIYQIENNNSTLINVTLQNNGTIINKLTNWEDLVGIDE